ncbi:MAG: response regulator [Polyangia bacterium]
MTQTPSPQHTLEAAFRAAHARRVLLAEDSESMRDMLECVLLKDGYDVTAVEDGDDLVAALDAAYGCAPELIITDVRMPGRSGLQVLEHLRARDRVTPVVLITAFGDAETHEEAGRLGAVVLDKPFALDELRAIAKRQLRPR